MSPRNIAAKTLKYLLLTLNLFVIVTTLYFIVKYCQKLNESRDEIERQWREPDMALLANQTSPDVLLENIATRRAALVSTEVIVILVGSMAIVGAFKRNVCILSAHATASLLLFALLALGWQNYISHPLLFGTCLGVTSLSAMMAVALARISKVDRPEWERLQAIANVRKDSVLF